MYPRENTPLKDVDSNGKVVILNQCKKAPTLIVAGFCVLVRVCQWVCWGGLGFFTWSVSGLN